MPAEHGFYNFDNVSVSLAGNPITGGYGDGGGVTISYDNERFEIFEGVDGSVVRSRTNSKLATVEITLAQTATANATLAALERNGRTSANGSDAGVFQLIDQENGDTFVAAKAWIQATPSWEHTRAGTDRVWTIKCADLENYPGGRA